MAEPYSLLPNGLRLAIRVTPRAPRTELGGLVDDAEGRSMLAIRIKAPPVDEAANTELIAFIAKALGVRKADIKIQSGDMGRIKIVAVRGDGETLQARAVAWIGEATKT
jgi:uncharacterized protein (TIGR00251 family)